MKLPASLISGRFVMGLSILALISLGIAIFLNEGLIRSIFFFVAALITVSVFGLEMMWARKKYSNLHTRFVKLSNDSENQLKNIHTAISAKIEKIEEPLLSQDICEIEEKIDSIMSNLGANPPATSNRYSPTFIKESQVSSQPNAHIAGRQAADLIIENSDTNRLLRALDSDMAKSVRIVAMISNHQFSNEIKDLGNIQYLRPDTVAATLSRETAYLVVDEESFLTGVWAGALTTQRTDLLLELLDLITSARKKGIVVIGMESRVPQHYTQTLRENMDILIGQEISAKDGSQAHLLPICVELAKIKGVVSK